MYMIWKTLHFRREHPDLFLQGDYVPLRTAGERAENVVAFARLSKAVQEGGSASAEAKITDSATGAILWEAVDRRGGTKSLRGVTNSWNDVEEAYRFWAEKFRYRACQLRGGMNCVEPKA